VTWQQALAHTLPPRASLVLRARYGNSREPELDLLPRLVRPGDTAIDIGAHKGVYTYWMSRLVGAAGRVVAYEPQPDLARFLRAGLSGPRLRNVELRTVALSDSAGVARLSIPVEGSQRVIGQATLEAGDASAVAVDVETRRLDDESLQAPVGLIKCDVEGHELKVLRGGAKLLDDQRPHLLVEVEYRHAGVAVIDTFDLLASIGYRAWYRDTEGKLHDLPSDWRSRPESLNSLSPGAYTNNFLFVHADRQQSVS
jgi:FkbM family methyltransferase